MGWQDAPVIDGPEPPYTPPPVPSPEGAAPAWQGAPIEATAEPSPAEPPSMGAVAANAIPKGIANLLNTPITLANLIMQIGRAHV